MARDEYLRGGEVHGLPAGAELPEPCHRPVVGRWSVKVRLVVRSPGIARGFGPVVDSRWRHACADLVVGPREVLGVCHPGGRETGNQSDVRAVSRRQAATAYVAVASDRAQFRSRQEFSVSPPTRASPVVPVRPQWSAKRSSLPMSARKDMAISKPGNASDRRAAIVLGRVTACGCLSTDMQIEVRAIEMERCHRRPQRQSQAMTGVRCSAIVL